ncbi:MAG: hypothetical protein B7Z07_01710 [Sphingomonadales bacterium 32-67-7]|nr:MAG: hypothetical protein B7Z07_01710 [Sphingomonadales bacterium 32-67-7]
MSLRRLLTAVVALSLLWAPVALQNGAALATAPADHSEQIVKGHCGGDTGSDKSGHASGKACCAAMCMGIETQPLAAAEPHALIGAPALTAVRRGGTGFLAELPTPPPRGG